jgi:hypothetical protein
MSCGDVALAISPHNPENRTMSDAVVDSTAPQLANNITEQMRDWALAQPHPVQRVLSYSAAGLLGMFQMLQSSIAQALAESDAPLESCSDLAPEVDQMLRLGRQAERFVTLARNYAPSPAGAASRQSGLADSRQAANGN